MLPNALSVLSDRHNIPGLYFGYVFVFNIYGVSWSLLKDFLGFHHTVLGPKSRFSDSCPLANAFRGQLEEYISKFLYSQTGLPQCLSYSLGLVVEEVFNFSLQ